MLPSGDPTPSANGPLGLGWLLRLRWVVAGGAVLATLVAALLGHLPGSAGWVAAGFVAWIAASQLLLLAPWARGEAQDRPARGSRVGLLFVADILALTVVLSLTGGPSNPFSVLYLLYVSLAAVALGSRWAWAIVVLCCASYGALFLPFGGDSSVLPGHAHHAHHHGAGAASNGSGMGTHLVGMWWAFAVSGALAAAFLTRMADEIRHRDQALAREREARERYVRLGSMLSLAAGAAHELGTPLGTIAVVAKELEHALPEELREDARVVRREVDRCREIVDRLSVRSGDMAGEAPTALGLRELRARVEAELPATCRQRLDVILGDEAPLYLPAQAFSVAIANLVVNACEASDPREPVELRMRVQGGVLEVDVRDRGEGVSPEQREAMFDPFVTTKGDSGGMGLGLYVVRTLLDQLGGGLALRAAERRGTVAELRVPARAGEASV